MEIVLGLLKDGAVQKVYFDSQFQFLSQAQQSKLTKMTAMNVEPWYIPKESIDSKLQKLMPPRTSEELNREFPKGIDADTVWDFANSARWGFFWKETTERKRQSGVPKRKGPKRK